MQKKGFPESYDLAALLSFLSDIKAGRQGAGAGLFAS
jgi:type I pantothenate kinase